jgi:HEAT repeat protein
MVNKPLATVLHALYHQERAHRQKRLERVTQPDPRLVALHFKTFSLEMMTPARRGPSSEGSITPFDDVLASSTSPDERMRAVRELHKMGTEDAITALINALNDPDEQVRVNIVKALGDLGDPRAVEPLAGILRSAVRPEDAGFHSIAAHAAWGLTDIGEPGIPALISALCECGEQVQVLAAAALADIGEDAVAPLIDALYNTPMIVRQKIVWVLWSIGDQRAVPPLMDALRAEDAKTRRYAAWALGQIGDERAIPALINILDDPHEKVRWDTTVALEKFGKVAVPLLINALKQGSVRIRISAANALGWLMDPSAIDALSDALRDPHDSVRSRAAFALGWIRDRRAVEPLLGALYDEDDDVRMQAIAALGWLRDPRAVEPLVGLIEAENEWLPYAAVEALGDIGDVSAIAPLKIVFEGPNFRVREAAREALRKLGVDGI